MRSTAGKIEQAEPLEQTVERELFRLIPAHRPPVPRVIVACSGGPDSSVLATALASTHHRNLIQLELAYVDHGLQSARHRRLERRSVERLAGELRVPLHIRSIRIDSNGHGGVEASARRRRYEMLADIQSARNACAVCTAHHLDDQVETVLMRLIQGSSLAGLGGMSDTAQIFGCFVVRPMLLIDRTSVMEYAKHRNLKPHRDRSNRSGRFLRNRMRKLLMPHLFSLRPGIREAVSRTARELRQTYNELVREPADTIPMTLSEQRVLIDRPRFFAAASRVRLERLRDACNHFESVPHRLPSEMFVPLLGVEPEAETLRAVDAHGVQIRLTRTHLVCELRHLVRRDQPRYSCTVQERSLAPDEVSRRSLDELLPPTMQFVSDTAHLVCRGPGPGTADQARWEERLIFREAVLSDWPSFAVSRAAFKRRLEREPEKFMVLEDVNAPVAILDFTDGRTPVLTAANTDRSHPERPHERACSVSIGAGAA
ncbi:MAG: tRNA lysidine(34) synthetase TilS [Spirochaetaceae bacterium]|nr:MAG: tRNA lysidine(34) synthetase TilS [Spirochaetaceae bacterium]